MALFTTKLPYRGAESETDTSEESDGTDLDYFEDGGGSEMELPARPKVMRSPQGFGQNTLSGGGNARRQARDLQVRYRGLEIRHRPMLRVEWATAEPHSFLRCPAKFPSTCVLFFFLSSATVICENVAQRTTNLDP